MKPESTIREEDLQAYVDGAVEPEKRVAIEAYFARNASEAARVARFVNQRDALREALGPIADEPLPVRLDVARIAARRTSAIRISLAQLSAAAFLLFVLGGASGYLLHAAQQPAQAGIGALAREAADSFRVHASDPERPVEFDARSKAELVRWFSARLQNPVHVPDLSAGGYRLLGGRLVTTPHGPAAWILYADSAGGKLAVFLRPMSIEKNTRMSEQVDGVLGSVAWADHGIGYTLVGAFEPQYLHPIADEVRRQVMQRGT